MRAKIEHEIVFLHHDDVPEYKKGGSVVRNSYFLGAAIDRGSSLSPARLGIRGGGMASATADVAIVYGIGLFGVTRDPTGISCSS